VGIRTPMQDYKTMGVTATIRVTRFNTLLYEKVFDCEPSIGMFLSKSEFLENVVCDFDL